VIIANRVVDGFALRIAEELLDIDSDGEPHRVEAAPALPRGLRRDVGGDEDAVVQPLQAEVDAELGSLRDDGGSLAQLLGQCDVELALAHLAGAVHHIVDVDRERGGAEVRHGPELYRRVAGSAALPPYPERMSTPLTDRPHFPVHPLLRKGVWPIVMAVALLAIIAAVVVPAMQGQFDVAIGMLVVLGLAALAVGALVALGRWGTQRPAAALMRRFPGRLAFPVGMTAESQDALRAAGIELPLTQLVALIDSQHLALWRVAAADRMTDQQPALTIPWTAIDRIYPGSASGRVGVRRVVWRALRLELHGPTGHIDLPLVIAGSPAHGDRLLDALAAHARIAAPRS
jgi:hypothetical protein